MDYEVLHNELVSILRPRGDPVGYKLFMERVQGLPYLKESLALCQVIKQVAIYGKVVAVDAESVDACVLGSYVLGFRPLPEDYAKRWIELRDFTEELYIKLVDSVHAFEIGKFKSALFAPLKYFKTRRLDPDGVVLVLNSTQVYMVLSAYFGATGVKPASDFNGHVACELLVPPLKGKSPWLTIPCGGARALSEVQDDEIWISMKPEDLEKVVNRLKKTGMKYPPPVYQVLVTPPNPHHPLTWLISRTPAKLQSG